MYAYTIKSRVENIQDAKTIQNDIIHINDRIILEHLTNLPPSWDQELSLEEWAEQFTSAPIPQYPTGLTKLINWDTFSSLISNPKIIEFNKVGNYLSNVDYFDLNSSISDYPYDALRTNGFYHKSKKIHEFLKKVWEKEQGLDSLAFKSVLGQYKTWEFNQKAANIPSLLKDSSFLKELTYTSDLADINSYYFLIQSLDNSSLKERREKILNFS